MWHRRHDLHSIRPQPPVARQLRLRSAGPGMVFLVLYPDLSGLLKPFIIFFFLNHGSTKDAISDFKVY